MVQDLIGSGEQAYKKNLRFRIGNFIRMTKIRGFYSNTHGQVYKEVGV
jgi:hypothetical protein